ncbi:MAG: Alanine racemase [Candidatus Latescibacteria bacterium ADurb.Bin168]|nr:MAG: Alanine racemase [Candidatus Latescibacteria bacterium ADurb.Bin168]
MASATRAIIDLEAFRANVRFVRELVGRRRLILACVKANAYGHGALRCANAALEAGADALGVARLDEALELRESGIGGRIVLIGPESLEASDDLVRADVEIAIDCAERLEAVLRAADATRRVPTVHLAVDSGMARFGASFDEASQLADRLSQAQDIRWAGVMTHFPVADSDQRRSLEQWRRFHALLRDWETRGIAVPCCHAANSAAIMGLPETHADMVRPGIMLYGIPPGTAYTSDRLRPVLRFETSVVALHWREERDYVGYGETFRCNRRTLIATIPAGYGDGIPWAAGNRSWVLVNGRKAPVVGRISMDQTTIDVTDLREVHLGDRVVLIGSESGQAITVDDWARWCGTISYEITTRLRGRPCEIRYVE